MSDRVLVICDQPGPRGGRTNPMQPDKPGSPGDRLRDALGLGKRAFKKQFELVNLLTSYRKRWPTRTAKEVADSMTQILAGRVCLLLGQRVCNAFGVGELEWLDGLWVDVLQSGERVRLVAVPTMCNKWWRGFRAIQEFRAAMVREDVIT